MSAPPPVEEKWARALLDLASALAGFEAVVAKHSIDPAVPLAERIRHAVRMVEEYRKHAEESQAAVALAKRQIDELTANVASRQKDILLLQSARSRGAQEEERLGVLLADANKAVEHWRSRSAAAESKIAAAAHKAGVAEASLAGVGDAKKILYNGIAGLLAQAEGAAADAERNDAGAAKEKLYGIVRRCKSLLEAR